MLEMAIVSVKIDSAYFHSVPRASPANLLRMPPGAPGPGSVVNLETADGHHKLANQ